MTNRTHSLILQLKPRALSAAIGLTLFASAVSQADSNYGPIAPGETLSKIVSENYLVSPHSDIVIMREIFRLNPESFINNNMGLLKQGVELVLPDDNSIRRSTGGQVVNVPVAPVPVQSRMRLVTVQESLRLANKESDDLKISLSRTQAELSSWKVRFENAQARLSEVTEKVVDTAPTSLGNDTSLASLESNLNKVRGEREAAKDQLVEAQEVLDDLKVKLEEAVSTESELKALLEVTRSSEADLKTELKAANDALALSKESLTESVESASSLKQGSSQQSVALIAAELTKQSLDKSTALIVEKDQEIALLKASVTDLEKQLEAIPAPVVATTSVSSNAVNIEANKTIADLNQQIAIYQEEVKELKSQNDELVNELMASAAPVGDMDSMMEVDPLVTDGLLPEESVIAEISDDSIESSNVGFFNRSVTLPTWSALLAMLALGLAAFMVILGRRNKSIPAVGSNATGMEDVVFKAGNLDARDQDVEALRVPPRRDPSRVAILDPSMTGELGNEPAVQSESEVSKSSNSDDSELKLVMAEAYIELADSQAANELLHEVLLEGTAQQKTSAELLMSRLAG
ncbi:FimV/HubP family polar landmark protein [Leucothrix arctica]|uniref:LysM domain-containing protein n=1 Tax=Leucothrix arctica TaxID=1481894 RepID=A0A317C5N0_9GAMM|nr:FimV/HubP family polar landmark protein [Leucothrix arctica]PWQ93904.1 hypothetical protein DKT75_20095 [Leucothrix arctica]